MPTIPSFAAGPPPTDPEQLWEAWREARDEARRAWGAWCAAAREQRGDAYAVFTAAGDREDAAERALAGAVSP